MEPLTPRLFGTSPFAPDAGWLDAAGVLTATGGNTGNMMFANSIMRLVGAAAESIKWGDDLSLN